MLNDTPLSRASSLPQWFGGRSQISGSTRSHRVLRYFSANRSTTLRPSLTAVTRFLTFPKEHLVAQHRFVRVFGLHMLDVVVVVGHADHQARSLTEVFTEATQVIEHVCNPRLRVWNGLEWRFFIRAFLGAPGGDADLERIEQDAEYHEQEQCRQ